MTRILHLTHTDIESDPRILRAIYAGVKAGNQVSGIGIAQGVKRKESSTPNHSSVIVNLARPKFLRRKSSQFNNWDLSEHLEVSSGKTGPLRRIIFIVWFAIRIIRIGRLHCPEIIHAHDTVVLPIAVILAAVTRGSVLYDAHELESDKAGSSGFQKKVIFAIEKICWPWVKGFITVSDAIGDWYLKHLGQPRATIVLNTPMSGSTGQLQGENSLRKTVRTDIKATSDDIICLYLGAFERGRGIERLINAFSHDAVTAKLVFLGDGSLRSEIEKSIANHQNIFTLPPVKHDYLVEYIRDATYGFSLIENVSLSDYLCLPNKMFEYLNAGLTVICSNFPEMQRVTTEHKFGFVVDESEDALDELLKHISVSPAPKKISSSQIRPFMWEAQESQLQALYVSMRKGN